GNPRDGGKAERLAGHDRKSGKLKRVCIIRFGNSLWVEHGSLQLAEKFAVALAFGWRSGLPLRNWRIFSIAFSR
ncbi:MAG: hypothetical protein WBV41_11165, partial [Terriglobales bacterium]